MSTPIPFAERANLSIPEAMSYTKLGRTAIAERLDSGRWLWFWEGTRKRIVRSSIDADQIAQGARAA